MFITLNNKKEFDHAATYLTTQTFCFDRYDSQLSFRFFNEAVRLRALTELQMSEGIMAAAPDNIA